MGFPLTDFIGPVEVPPRSIPTEGIFEIPSIAFAASKGVSPIGDGENFEMSATGVPTLSSFISSSPLSGVSPAGSPRWELSFAG